MNINHALVVLIVLLGLYYLYRQKESFYDPSSGLFYDDYDYYYDPYYTSLYYYPYDYPFWWYYFPYYGSNWGGGSWNYGRKYWPYYNKNWHYKNGKPYHHMPRTGKSSFPGAGHTTSFTRSPKGIAGRGGYPAGGGRIGGISARGSGRGSSFGGHGGGGARGGGGGRR